MSRTFWMRVFAAANVILIGTFLYILVGIILPSTDAATAAFVPIFVVFLALFIVVALGATVWASAPRRPWFWLVGVVPAALFLLLNAPFLPYSLTHPTDVQGFTAGLPLVVVTVVLLVAGWRSFRDARAGSQSASPRRAVPVLLAVAAATVAAVATSLLTQGGGGAAAGEVSSTEMLEVRDVKFVQPTLAATSGGTLGIVVVNHDAFAHSFDIDALGVHVPLPANASVLVTVAPTASGSLRFYCAVPGHDATMNGTISVS